MSHDQQQLQGQQLQQWERNSRIQQGRLGPDRAAVGMRASEKQACAVVGDSANSYESERRGSCEGTLSNEKAGRGYYAEFHGGGE